MRHTTNKRRYFRTVQPDSTLPFNEWGVYIVGTLRAMQAEGIRHTQRKHESINDGIRQTEDTQRVGTNARDKEPHRSE